MPTLLLPDRYTPDSVALWRAAIARGWDARRAPSWRAPAGLLPADVAVYGEPLFAAAMAEQVGLELVAPAPDWLATLSRAHLGREVRFMDLAAARAVAGPAFIKPAADKTFRAAVYPSGAALPNDDAVAPHTPMLVSEPVTWELEARCFLLERCVVATTLYARHGSPAAPPALDWPCSPAESAGIATCMAALLADEQVVLPPAIVVDVGRMAGRGWAVVEANAAYASGLYGADPNAVLDVVRRACGPRRG
jgi:hypothetical protein